MSSLTKKFHMRPATVGLLTLILTCTMSLSGRSQDLSLTKETPSQTVREGDPFIKLVPHREPIPLAWKIAIALGVLAICSGLLLISMRVWRSSNLFDRQYRFPKASTAALRLGGNRSGGLMASIKFGDRAGPEIER
jgi:hypothetical protein